MSPRLAFNLGLATLIAILGTYLFMGEGKAPGRIPSAPLSALDPGTIKRIELLRAGHSPLRLVREGDIWMQHWPLKIAADEFKVNSLLSMLRAPARPIETGTAGRDEFGLVPPAAELRFDDTVFLVGGTEPAGGKRYMEVNGQVVLLADNWYSHLFATPERWVDPRPLAGLSAITVIDFGHSRWILDNGRWRQSRQNASEDAGGAETGLQLAQAWTGARALAVSAVDESLPWSVQVSLELDQPPTRREFRIAAVARMVFLARREPPLQYQFSQRQAAALLPGTDPP